MIYDNAFNELQDFQTICDDLDSVQDFDKILKCKDLVDDELKPFLYPLGSGDVKRNFEYYKKLAEKGEPDAQHYVGVCYMVGVGTKMDEISADKWIKLSCEQNYPSAILAQSNKNPNIPKTKLKEAFEKVKKLADKGDANAQYDVCASYHFGVGVDKDPNSMLKYCKLSADQSHILGLIAMYTMYDKGDNVQQDKQKALVYLKKAADLGIPLAQFYWGIAHRESNKATSLKYLKMSAEQGFSEADKELKKLNQ